MLQPICTKAREKKVFCYIKVLLQSLLIFVDICGGRQCCLAQSIPPTQNLNSSQNRTKQLVSGCSVEKQQTKLVGKSYATKQVGIGVSSSSINCVLIFTIISKASIYF